MTLHLKLLVIEYPVFDMDDTTVLKPLLAIETTYN